MLRYLVRVSLENRFVVVLLAAALVAVGVVIALLQAAVLKNAGS